LQGIGAEALLAALRRAALPVAVAIVIGATAMVALQAAKGPLYAASARVLVPSAPLSRIITGTQVYIDPRTAQATELELAHSPEVFDLAASATGNSYGNAGTMRGSTAVSAQSGDILAFSASSKTPRAAIGIANAVARAYIRWRASLTSNAVGKSITQLQDRLSTLPAGDPARSDLQSELTKLEVLNTLTSTDTLLVQPAGGAGKTRPAPIHDALLGAALGLLLGLLMSALREAIDTKVRSERDVEDELSVPVLASIRTLPRKVRVVMYGRYERFFADTYALIAAQLTQAAQRLQGAARAQGTVIGITSALPREGKTTTTCNVAVALARRGARVLLIDFDLRKPEVGRTFGIPLGAPGVVDVLAGSATLEAAVRTIAVENGRLIGLPETNGASAPIASDGSATTIGSLHVLPAGRAVKTHTLADSTELAALLRQLRLTYDFIIMDTPPALLTVEMADLGQHIDLVLLVIRQGKASQRSLRTLNRHAQKWPAELVGAVLTDAPGQQSYGSYYGE
jgi:Mrp family chromosome partitioning ATPase/capsular polysaccharide biosynthesis protein